MTSRTEEEKRIYGGDPNLIHVADGTRARMGKLLAIELDWQMREAAYKAGTRSGEQAFGSYEVAPQRLCPGCYMVVAFDMLIALAEANGQSITELARSMIGAFQELQVSEEMFGGNGSFKEAYREDIRVLLDPPDLCPWTNGDLENNSEALQRTYA